MTWKLEKGKFVKQYFVNFPDGVEYYGWIFLKNDNEVTSGFRFKYPDGQKNFYNLTEKMDSSDLLELEEKLLFMVKEVSSQAGVEYHELDLNSENVEDQVKEMVKMGVAGELEEWENTAGRENPELS